MINDGILHSVPFLVFYYLTTNSTCTTMFYPEKQKCFMYITMVINIRMSLITCLLKYSTYIVDK